MTIKEKAIKILEDAVIDFGLPPDHEDCVSYSGLGFCSYVILHPLMKGCSKQYYNKIVNLICNIDQTETFWFTGGRSQQFVWKYEKDLKYERRDFAIKRLRELKH